MSTLAMQVSRARWPSRCATSFRYLCLLLSLPVLWLLGRPLAASAWQNLRHGGPTTDLLMVLGVAAAMIYSAISVFRGSGHVYFEVGCVVLVMVTVGRWLDATGKVQTTAALDALEKLLPDQVRVVRAGHVSIVACETIRTGDCLQVLAGERFGFDGRLFAGSANVDEQIITGESRPVTKEPTDAVYAGSMNLDGDLLVTVTAERREGALERMIEMVRQARFGQRLSRAAGRSHQCLVSPRGRRAGHRNVCDPRDAQRIRAGFTRQPGGVAHCLSLRTGARHAYGRVGRARKGFAGASPGAQRRGSRAVGRGACPRAG